MGNLSNQYNFDSRYFLNKIGSYPHFLIIYYSWKQETLVNKRLSRGIKTSPVKHFMGILLTC